MTTRMITVITTTVIRAAINPFLTGSPFPSPEEIKVIDIDLINMIIYHMISQSKLNTLLTLDHMFTGLS